MEVTEKDYQQSIYNWWLKVRWFVVMVLFAVCIIKIGESQTLPAILFIVIFFSIIILNFLFYLQIISQKNIFFVIQILLDMIFATLVVHLTGGIESSFVWIFLISIITAGITIEKSGSFITAMIASLCLLSLILLYEFGALIPVNNQPFDKNTGQLTIFMISYTGLFASIAVISNISNTLANKLSDAINNKDKEIRKYIMQIDEKDELVNTIKKRQDEYKELVKTSAQISTLDHDINTPLTVIALSVKNIQLAANKFNDERLSSTGDNITESINRIKEILKKLRILKINKLIKEFISS